jgi:hypothetical protein
VFFDLEMFFNNLIDPFITNTTGILYWVYSPLDLTTVIHTNYNGTDVLPLENLTYFN